MSDDVLVRPLLRVVANGRRRDKDKTWLKLTVVATPEYPRAGDSTAGTFALQNWPAEMAQRAREGLAPFEGKAIMTVLARRISAAKVPSLMNRPEWDANVPATLSRRTAFDNVEAWKTISAQWQDALAKQNAPLW